MDFRDKASDYVVKYARYYERGIPPHYEMYGVSYKGRAFVSNDMAELVLKLQAFMEQEGI